MTTSIFIEWLHHFNSYKPKGVCLLIFDGAKSHLDYEIVTTAERYDILLYCLPSNTTHELQPMDKAVFKPFEEFWDQEVQLYWCNPAKSSFRACGIFPFDPNAIPEEAFLPSTASEIPLKPALPMENSNVDEPDPSGLNRSAASTPLSLKNKNSYTIGLTQFSNNKKLNLHERMFRKKTLNDFNVNLH